MMTDLSLAKSVNRNGRGSTCIVSDLTGTEVDSTEQVNAVFEELQCVGGGIFIEDGSLDAVNLTVDENAVNGIDASGDVTIDTGMVCNNQIENIVADGSVDILNVITGDECPEPQFPFVIDTDEDGIDDDEDTDDDNDGIDDVDDIFPFDAGESVDTDGDGSGDNADTDDDDDGIPDSVEVENNLDPLSADDADLDSDGDGLSNLEEHQQGLDILRDDFPPTILLTTPRTIAATGRLTILETTEVTASDIEGGDAVVDVDVSVSPQGPYKSGRNELEWTATDNIGNVATLSQVLLIEPLVSISAGQQSGEGNAVNATLALSGEAAVYPVDLTYEISGTSDENDHSGLTGSVSIESGVVGNISFEILADDLTEGDESLVITLTEANGAVLSDQIAHTVTITEENVAPTGVIIVRQAGEDRRVLSQTDGVVTVSVDARDANPGDSLSFDWSETSTSLVLDAVDQSETSFDPSLPAEGQYRLRLIIADDADAQGVTRLSKLVQIVDELEALSATTDSDNDGINDVDEGRNDTDGDGIEDYRDNNDDPTILPLASGSDDEVISTEAGLQLKLGDIGTISDKGGAVVTDEDIALLLDETSAPLDNTDDTEFDHPLGLYDFKVDGLSVVGQAVRIILPLAEAIPADAVYRKYTVTSGWQDFVEDDLNMIGSASDAQGICPPIGDSYEEGLIEGRFCIQLTIIDGGLNDADGNENGSISDPGGVGVLIPVVEPAADAPVASDSDLGCFIATAAYGSDLTIAQHSWLREITRDLLTPEIPVVKHPRETACLFALLTMVILVRYRRKIKEQIL